VGSRRRTTEREQARATTLHAWAATAEVNVDRFDEGQQWVLFAALNIMDFVGTLPVMRRVTGYLLTHCGMGLGTGVISSVIGLSDRSLRVAQALEPKQMLHSIRHPTGGHRKPKLKAEDAGVVARYLFEHPESEVKEVLAFIRTRFGVTMDRLTLRRFVARFGLGCLRDESIRDAAPFLATPSTEVRSS
jgi:hypothetical protein